jgi:branched-subunit amino acid transport protein
MWTSTNISKKGSEVIPAWDDFNAARTVVFVSMIVWIVAARAHSFPSIVKRVLFFLSAGVVVAIIFASSTTTRAYTAASKIVRRDKAFFSTIATAVPHNGSVWIPFGRWSNSYQVAKTLARYVNAFEWVGAAARICMAAQEIASRLATQRAAFASATPQHTSCGSSFSRRVKRNQSTVTLVCDIPRGGHRSGSIGSRSSGGVVLTTPRRCEI